MADRFDEHGMRAAITEKWGPAGAHIEVFDAMVRRIAELEAEKANLVKINAALRNRPDLGDRARRVDELLRERAGLLADVERLETERDAWRQLAMRLRPSVMFNVTEDQG